MSKVTDIKRLASGHYVITFEKGVTGVEIMRAVEDLRRQKDIPVVEQSALLATGIFAADPRVQQRVRERGEVRGLHASLVPLIAKAWDLGKAKPESEEGVWRREAEAKAEEVGRYMDHIAEAATAHSRQKTAEEAHSQQKTANSKHCGCGRSDCSYYEEMTALEEASQKPPAVSHQFVHTSTHATREVGKPEADLRISQVKGGPNGSIYFTEDGVLKKRDRNGAVSPVKVVADGSGYRDADDPTHSEGRLEINSSYGKQGEFCLRSHVGGYTDIIGAKIS